ncbi:hypothetical protein ABTY61_28135 [Kitasatospora sp. NPDC096128]|uniref:hypothetical protein n=1 Tax=Kitasatospora sp. NPDC096128 TaxID=3155547 RepID=UPI00331934D8
MVATVGRGRSRAGKACPDASAVAIRTGGEADPAFRPGTGLRTVQTRLLALPDWYADGPLSMDHRFVPDKTTQRTIGLLAALLDGASQGRTPPRPRVPMARRL